MGLEDNAFLLILPLMPWILLFISTFFNYKLSRIILTKIDTKSSDCDSGENCYKNCKR